MPLMITDGQKSYINELLERTTVDLADLIDKELDKLTCREAADIIDDLKSELRAQRLHQQFSRER